MQVPVHRPAQSSKMQPGPAQPPIRLRSDPAPLELTYQRERLDKLLREGELLSLLKDHFNETDPDRDHTSVDVDWDYYLGAERVGRLVVFTARDGAALVGYVFTLIGPHHHKQGVLTGFVTMYWLHPANRVWMAGYKLLRDNEVLLKKLGVQKVLVAEMLGMRTDVLFKRMGYAAEETLYGKWL